MRVMVLVKANRDSEAGRMPSTGELTEMGAYNERLVTAGIMRAGDGLAASSEGKRVRFGGDELVVIDGPFTETGELVAGFWIWEVASLDEAVDWLKQAPFKEGEVELRRLYEPEDFGEAYTPELREQEERLRRETESRPG